MCFLSGVWLSAKANQHYRGSAKLYTKTQLSFYSAFTPVCGSCWVRLVSVKELFWLWLLIWCAVNLQLLWSVHSKSWKLTPIDDIICVFACFTQFFHSCLSLNKLPLQSSLLFFPHNSLNTSAADKCKCCYVCKVSMVNPVGQNHVSV